MAIVAIVDVVRATLSNLYNAARRLIKVHAAISVTKVGKSGQC
jgi:hypothetical protein